MRYDKPGQEAHLAALAAGDLPYRGERGLDRHAPGGVAPSEGEARFLRTIIQSISDVVVVLGADGAIRYENGAVEHVLGYLPGERVGSSAFEHVHPDDAERARDSFADALTEPGIHPPVRFRVRHADGSWRYIETIHKNLLEDPAVRGMVTVSRDVTEREKAEETLRRSRARFRAIFDVSAIGMALVDAEGRLKESNPALQEMLGYSDEELRGTGFEDVTHPDDVADDARLFEKMMAGELDHFTLEKRYVRKDGSVLWGHLTSSVIRANEERPRLMVGMVEDITERKEAEKTLRESEERHRRQTLELALLHRVRTALAQELELPAVFRAVVEAVAEAYGYTQVSAYLLEDEELVLQHQVGYERVIERVPIALGVMGRVARTGEPVLLEDVRSDPAFLGAIEGIVSEVCVPLFDGGRVAGTLNVECTSGVDLTEDDLRLMGALAEHVGIAIGQARLYDRVRRSEERFRSLIQNAPDAIMILDADSTIRYDSPAIERMLGYEPGERLGTEGFAYVHPEDLERARDTFAEVLDDPGIGRPVEYRLRHKDGSWRHVEAVRTNLLDEPSIEGVVLNARDVTERKRAEKDLRESEERYRAVVERTTDGIFLADFSTIRILESNAALQDMLGYTAEELRGMSLYEVIAADPELIDRNTRRILEEKSLFLGERRYRRKDGSVVNVESSASVIPYGDKEVSCCIARDITERKRAEKDLHESEERYRAVVEQSIESIYLFDPDTGRVLESNAAFQQLLGYASGELDRMTIHDFVAHEREDIELDVRRHLAEQQRFVGERRYRRKDGSLIEVQASATVIPYHDGEAVCVVARDVTERNRLQEELTRQAFHDSLTELPNRALFLDRLQHALARVGREGGSVAVLFVDLDDFKVINDSLGHEAGDALLKGVAGRLGSCVRPGDTVARLSGDEFGVLLEAPAEVEEARRVTERIMEHLQAPFDLDGGEVFVNSSIGIGSGSAAEGEQPADVLRRADLAMYVAKNRGKGGYELFIPSMNTRAQERMELENQLRRAVEREEFEVHYQPVVELGTGRIEGLEALVRWRHPERGLIAAEEFIRRAEETGLIRPIGKWVFEEACRQARRWDEQFPERSFAIMVNFSASQFAHQADLIPKVLGESGLEPDRLILEITERAVMDDAEFALGKLRRLKGLGVKFAIDDYGIGYSSLRYLKLMPVDFLKIDREFVAGLGKDPGDEAIVLGTIDLAHALGLKVVAEGVETADQLRHLKELKCDLVQGFHLSYPLLASQASALLAQGFMNPQG